ncbi:nucleolar protein of 40 kDa isoform X1 [Dermochelys coriacea]|uniref:nucleolar protein of 40 kDa isoform X1 n=1 Tax=Dermochelys coriacea TaxID=27794 RepID=UPI0018E85FAB|nr:nucleolar protein of 40 kDa isoform X1 [Dermochelys coriacea]XP_038233434.1 nucleolar protein of 40 kDa isoform X1 [Dermochelys coriacea]XP_038233437.1 nucleolar protein of 40 kDa isoform X1 [Dermochelys coriacea]XP_043362139.1 nucleolar protein of 40 kDa isoform X1 [Dermochelys coriacea]
MKSVRPETMETLPELYDVFQGEVAAVTEYGAFIKIPGCRKQGLVHKTHMSACRVDKPSEMVDVGDKVWVKLIGREMKDDKLKLSLSMKVVNQGTGKDLDPNNVALDQDERKKRSFRDYTSQKITLEAVLNTVCKKCGCKGHFAKECFMQPGGTKYSLIPEEEETAEYEGDKKSSHTENSSKKRKKEKKKKKKHKSKKSSESDNSDSSDLDSDGAQPASKRAKHSEKASKPQKKKKKKKHKKKHKE